MTAGRLVAPLLLAAALFAGCTLPAPATAEPPRPLLWKVSDGDNSVYLLGAFHLLRPGDYPLAASAEAAYADAEQLVFELAPAETSSPALGRQLQAAGLRSDGRTLQATLPPALWTRLAAHMQARGGDAQSLQAMDAWFVGLVLAIGEMQALGLDPGNGLDRHFSERAVADGKPTRGLETGAQQIAMFEGMSATEQVESLEDSLGEVAEMQARIERLHALWRSGDAEGLATETVVEMQREYPGLYAQLNRDRNRAWLPVLRTLLDDGRSDDALVVVGAMHLLGDDGLVALLRAQGYTVERL